MPALFRLASQVIRAKLRATVQPMETAMKLHILLFAAAAVILPPAIVSAEIALTGQAVMGLGLEQGKTTAISDIELTLHATRITDGGVEFGAMIDLNTPQSAGPRQGPPRAILYMSTGDFIGTGAN